MPKGDKKKKKEVTAQITQLELEIKQKHEVELDEFLKVVMLLITSPQHSPFKVMLYTISDSLKYRRLPTVSFSGINA